MTKQLPRGVRNNNPGNIERGKDRWLGMAQDQSSDNRFLVFDTPESGIRALMRVLINYQERHGIDTLREAINRWAPPAENNSTAYVQHVARLTGFDPDERLDFLDREVNVSLAKAIIRHENGEPSLYGLKEWYADDVYERAAVMAGFEPTATPLKKSRTLAGVAAAAGATVVAMAAPGLTPEDVSTVTAAANAFGWSKVAELLPHVVALLGLAFAAYARWDDAKRRLR